MRKKNSLSAFRSVYIGQTCRALFLFLAMLTSSTLTFAQRPVDRLDRGLIAQKVSNGVFLSWRILGEEYYDVQYNVYRDGVKITDTPLNVSNYRDASGSTSNKYTVSAVVRGVEQPQSKEATVWSKSYLEIVPKHDKSLKSTYIPNDACCADVDGDGELEILLKYDNQSEMAASYPRNGYNGEYSLFECLKLDGTVLWWVNCGPNMGDFQNNEQNIVAYDWDGDGKAEAVMRAADGTTIHMADGTVYTVGDASKNYRGATGGGTNWFMHDGAEYLVYMNGQTGKPYQCITYPLARLEPGETDLNAAWGDGYGHRSTKHFFGAPYLDGRKPSIFLARGIYTRHKMIAYDVDPASHELVVRWKWYNNNWGPWKGQGYHNYGVADVDMDGRDEICFGSMVIDDNGKGLSSTSLGHGDAQHHGDFNPYIHGLEIYACNEDHPGNNYRDGTTSKIYHRYEAGNDDGRAMADNFCNSFPGALGCSAREGAISLVTNSAVPGLDATGVNTNFRIYWDGDLCSETFNYLNGKNTEGCVAKYGSWSPIYVCEGSMTNNDTKGTPCYQGDVFGDWREEIIMRTAANNIRIYSTTTATKWRNYTLWHDHQYRNAMVWQMCGYNQPPHVSYYLGEMEGITVAPPPLIMTGRTEVANGGTIGKSLNDKHVIVCETGNTNVSIENGVEPYIVTFNVGSWVQGSAVSESTVSNPKITYDYYTCNVTGGAIGGKARLIKQGDGTLNLPKVNMTYTGETNIWGGIVNFDGTMANSNVWLNHFTQLNSNGGEFKSIKATYGSVIRPGGENSKGNITVDSTLFLGFGSRLVLDLYGSTVDGDLIKAKTLRVEKKTGEAWTKYGPEYIQPVIEINGIGLVAGDYVIAEADSVIGSVTNIKIEGVNDFKTGIKYENGKVVLSIGDVRGASTIIWTGASNTIWDFANTKNFILSGDESEAPEAFVYGDAVEFNDDAKNFTVTINENVQVESINVNNTKAYTFNGTGSITSGSLTKEGKGSLTINTLNSYTGGNHLLGGTTIVSALSNDVDATGNLGGVIINANNFTIENGAVLQTNQAVKNGSPIRFVGEEGGVINNSADFVQQKSFSGTKLTKRGAGWLKTSAAGSALNRLVIAAGTVQNGNGNAAKVVELSGGSLVDNVGTSNEINIPEKKTGSWTTGNRCTYSNALTGAGTINVYCATEKGSNYYATRTPIRLNLSNFEGTLVAGATYTADGRFTFDTSTGGTKWTLNIPDGIYVQNSGKTLRMGAVTGKGSLGGFCTFSNNGASGTNTWQVGNDEDFKFEGLVIGGDRFTKMGSGKMTATGVWTTTGAVSISEGALICTSGGSLGTGALTVEKNGTLMGINNTGTSMTNSSFTINGTVHPGSSASAFTGSLDFNGKNVTFNNSSTLEVVMRRSNTTESTLGGTGIKNINKLTFNGTVAVELYRSYTPVVGDELRLWADVKSFTGNPSFELPETHETNDSIYTITWDTSDIANGIVRVSALNVVDGINSIIADTENVKVEVMSVNGAAICEFYCPMGSLKNSFAKTGLSKGVYILRLTSESGKQKSVKMMK